MTNKELAHFLKAIAAAYEIKDEDKNIFKIKAYQRAADAVEHLSSEAKDLWDDDKLKDVGGIGKSIAAHIDEIFKTGKSKHFNKVTKGIGPSTFEFMKISGIGPKTAHKLAKELNIKSDKGAIDKLQKACKKNKIEKIEGLGKDSQEAILKSINELKQRKDRILLSYALGVSEEIISWMKKEEKALKVDALGSLRRRASTVGDIDISVSSKDPKNVIKHFINYPKKIRVIEKGDTDASILIQGDLQVDLKVGKPVSYGALLQHFTGSKHHNIALREYAQKKKLSLSEYGIKKGKKTHKTKTEKEFYQKLGMEFIPPELREATGEIQVAIDDNLPDLITLKDIKADLQIHSDYDIETSHDLGESSMKKLINKAGDLGYEYLAFTEHNPSQSGHKEKDIIDLLKAKKENVDKLNDSYVNRREIKVKYVFNSLEIDILPNGDLPVPEKAFKYLDFALVSIHSSFSQTRKKMTSRIIKALDNPKVKIFAHPTGRLLNQREGVEIDWDKLFDYIKKNNKFLEINADPKRLDLPDFKVKEAIDNHIKLTLGTDAHHLDGLENMKYGVFVARRGWAKTKDILNTYSLNKFKKVINL